MYVANLVTFTVSLLPAGLTARDDAHASSTTVTAPRWRRGLRYALSRPDIVGTYVIDLLAMVLAFPVVMLPFVAERFHETYALSLLYCGLPARGTGRHVDCRRGRTGCTTTVARSSSRPRSGASASRSSATRTSLWLVLVGLAIGGGADAISGIFRSTMWNESIPPDMRGRMAGIEMISYSLGPTAGQFRAGVMAAWTTLRFSLTFGGLACTGSVGAVARGAARAVDASTRAPTCTSPRCARCARARTRSPRRRVAASTL